MKRTRLKKIIKEELSKYSLMEQGGKTLFVVHGRGGIYGAFTTKEMAKQAAMYARVEQMLDGHVLSDARVAEVQLNDIDRFSDEVVQHAGSLLGGAGE